jgi:hypothetical protein
LALITTKGLVDFEPDKPLDPVWYGIHVEDAKVQKDGYSVMLKSVVIEGPEQKDGSDPVGRTVTDFVRFGGYETHKDGGKFAKTIATSLLDAAGLEREAFDPDELIGKEVNGLVNVGSDQRTGLPREGFILFSAREE